MKDLVVIICLVFSFQLFSQNIESKYFSHGNNESEFVLEFINDSIVDLKSIPRHMYGFFSSRIKFSNSENRINIHFKKHIINTDDFRRYGLKKLIDKKISLVKLGEELIDYENKIVFVSTKNYHKRSNQNKVLSIIDGKRVVSRAAKTNGYGIITKRGKIHGDIKRLLRNMQKDSNYYKITRLSGFDAYNDYGIIGLRGVTIYESKN